MSDLSAELASDSAFFLRSTAPAQNTAVHSTLPVGSLVRASAALTINGSLQPTPSTAVSFSDIGSIPAAIPPPPSEGLGGGRTSYIRKQGTGGGDFAFDYGYAFALHRAEAFARDGFGTACSGLQCKSSAPVYSRKNPPFHWERTRIRGGAVICPGKGGHLICLRCVDAQYTADTPFISVCTGKPIHRADLFAKYEAIPAAMEVKPAGEDAARPGGQQFFVQRRDLAECPDCLRASHGRVGADSRRGELKRARMAKRTVAGREAVKEKLVSARDIQGMSLLNLEDVYHAPPYACSASECTASFGCSDYA
jgi:hypothetical protein